MSPTPSMCIIFVRQSSVSWESVRDVTHDPSCVCKVTPFFYFFSLRSVCHCQCYDCGAGVILSFLLPIGVSWRPLAVGRGSGATSQCPLTPAEYKTKQKTQTLLVLSGKNEAKPQIFCAVFILFF